MALRRFPSVKQTDSYALEAASLRQKNNQLEEALRALETEHCSLWASVLRNGGAAEDDVPAKYRERVRRITGGSHE